MSTQERRFFEEPAFSIPCVASTRQGGGGFRGLIGESIHASRAIDVLRGILHRASRRRPHRQGPTESEHGMLSGRLSHLDRRIEKGERRSLGLRRCRERPGSCEGRRLRYRGFDAVFALCQGSVLHCPRMKRPEDGKARRDRAAPARFFHALFPLVVGGHSPSSRVSSTTGMIDYEIPARPFTPCKRDHGVPCYDPKSMGNRKAAPGVRT